MKAIILFILSVVLLSSCTKDKDVIQIRLSNISDFEFKDI
jgi:hypothetical protein